MNWDEELRKMKEADDAVTREEDALRHFYLRRRKNYIDNVRAGRERKRRRRSLIKSWIKRMIRLGISESFATSMAENEEPRVHEEPCVLTEPTKDDQPK